VPRLLASVESKWTLDGAKGEPTLDLLPCHSDWEACLPCSFRVSSVQARAFKEVPWVLEPRATWERWRAAGADGAVILARSPADVDPARDRRRALVGEKKACRPTR
jgi:hypothetical protein